MWVSDGMGLMGLVIRETKQQQRLELSAWSTDLWEVGGGKLDMKLHQNFESKKMWWSSVLVSHPGSAGQNLCPGSSQISPMCLFIWVFIFILYKNLGKNARRCFPGLWEPSQQIIKPKEVVGTPDLELVGQKLRGQPGLVTGVWPVEPSRGTEPITCGIWHYLWVDGVRVELNL